MKKKTKRNFNARYEAEVHEAIVYVAKTMDTNKTNAVKRVMLAVAETLKLKRKKLYP